MNYWWQLAQMTDVFPTQSAINRAPTGSPRFNQCGGPGGGKVPGARKGRHYSSSSQFKLVRALLD